MPINQVLTGWIQKDIALRYTPTGKAVMGFSLATPAGQEENEDGEKKKVYTYVRCTAWNELAEDVNENYKEGDLVEIKGILKAATPWTPKNGGDTRSSIEFTFFEIIHVK
jgi:single-strand DNA-binding protein